MSGQIHRGWKLAVAALVALAASACTQAARYDGASKVARNEIHLVRLSHALPASEELGDAGRAGIERFLADIEAGYGDTISIVAAPDYPDTAADAIADLLLDHGLVLAAPPATLAEVPRDGGAILVVDRYVVTPPQCPSTIMHATRNYMNAPSPQFGCANVINLGQMVADPRDLVTGRSGAAANTEKATQGIQLWREDTPAIVAPQNTDSGTSSFGGSGAGGGGF
ncbi:MAG: hypothetical protein D6807_02685 [Alphaproteobacteria bacterium]|nr:MAG: hypothetical protein D6807_02685 [Alphaproteobacteria bacterium]